MLAEAKQDGLRQKMQALKDLYTSRHYTQCAKFGERLLGDVDSNAHPLHLAFLNFYTALSHDTLAREATLKNRYRELITAEKYYCAAIAILSPQLTPCSTPSLDEDQPSTPDSVTFPEESVWLRRLKATSYVSYRTSACSAMSEAVVPEQDMDFALSNLSFPQPPGMGMPVDLPDTGKLHPGYTGRNSMLVPLSTQFVRPKSTPPPAQLPPDTSSFVDMLQGHLASVRSLKENTGVRGIKFGIPSPSSSPTKPQLRIWRPSDLPDEQKEALQKRRREMTWRPRFDPRSIRKLCDEALDEI